MPDTNSPIITYTPDIGTAVSPGHAAKHAHADIQRIERDAAEAKRAYKAMPKAKHLVVIGTGGSTLGAKMLCAFGEDAPRVLFAETVDAQSTRAILKQITLEETLFLVVSKSGSTIESLSLYGLFAQQYQPEDIAKHFLFITDPGPSPLRCIAENLTAQIIDHPANIGGRYSIFTVVGLLPALFASVDIDRFIAGAAAYLKAPYWPQTAAWHLAQYQRDKHITVMLPYVSQLSHYTYWWRQLWAESLGKNGHFTTPFASIGSVDQHSQLQLWLDGPQDKSFTLISADEDAPLTLDGNTLPSSIYPYATNQSTQTIQHALVEGTIHSLRQAGLPVCHMHFASFGVGELGMLVMHGLGEVVAIAHALDINPFDQPAVEIGKSKAKALLLGK